MDGDQRTWRCACGWRATWAVGGVHPHQAFIFKLLELRGPSSCGCYTLITVYGFFHLKHRHITLENVIKARTMQPDRELPVSNKCMKFDENYGSLVLKSDPAQCIRGDYFPKNRTSVVTRYAVNELSWMTSHICASLYFSQSKNWRLLLERE
jgi:hypothetical protein